MLGCLFKTIFSLIIVAVVAVIIFVFTTFGGMEYVKTLVDSWANPPKNTVQQQARRIGDFSAMPNDCKLVRTVDMFGLTAAVAENNKTAQKMAVINPGWAINITKMIFAQMISEPNFRNS